ncbi:hypothetical protein FACS1894154_07950 [Betaproteobacteria bacterium]|nr:hypothetical protein FACS1894154_07950 [Betaproteobacteria bacterium]
MNAIPKPQHFQQPAPTATTGLTWTQEEAVAFECAREVITHLMAIHTRQIHEERNKRVPDLNRVEQLLAERSRLFQEQKNLHVQDSNKVARIRREYGAIIREWRDAHKIAVVS